jgi:hypothetical protein
MPYVEETLNTKDGVKIRSYIITLKDEEAAKKAPTIIYHHANAGNMGHRLPIAKVFYEKFNANVVMLSYRGYGLSEGNPSDKGLRIDAQVKPSLIPCKARHDGHHDTHCALSTCTDYVGLCTGSPNIGKDQHHCLWSVPWRRSGH